MCPDCELTKTALQNVKVNTSEIPIELRLKIYRAVLEILLSTAKQQGTCTICSALKAVEHLMNFNDISYTADDTVKRYSEIFSRRPKKARPSLPWWPLRNMERRITVMEEIISKMESPKFPRLKKDKQYKTTQLRKSKFNSY